MEVSNKNQLKQTNLTIFQFSLLLILTSVVIRLSSSLYLPALIKIGESLQLSDSTLSLTLTVFFVAFSISTLFAGPLSDYFGRKATIVGGLSIFLIGSLMCAFAGSSYMLFAGRILQAVGGSCIPVSGRAMIRDVCSDIQVMSVLGWMAVVGGLTPIVAPMLGGFITDLLGWQYNFWFLAIFSAFAIIILSLKLPKIVTENREQSLNIKIILGKYKKMITSPEFIIVILPLGLAFSIQGAYLTAAPFIFMKHFGLSAIEFGLMNIVIVLSMFIGKYISTNVTKRFSMYTAYITGGFITFIGSLLFGTIIFSSINSLSSVLITLSVVVVGFGVLLPIGTKSILTAYKSNAGTVSALLGFVSTGFTSLGSLSISLFQKYQIPYLQSMALFIIPAGAIILAVSTRTRKHLK
ncbi:MAG: MFS transporter [Deltaproteobacteria bacterium]|nr:MFS transporter [Candidatus Tharpella aukensis]